ncbi:MAG TPA: ATP-binding protein [Vicinamibacterales bacterium]
MTLSIFQKGLLVLSLAFLGLVALAVASVRSHVRHVHAQERALRASEVLVTGQRVLGLLVDIETSVRAFVITYNEDFLEPYQEAVRELDPSLDRLHELVESDPENLRLAQIVARDARTVARWHAETVDLARGGEGELAIERATAGNKARMDGLRISVNALLARERRGAEDAMAALEAEQRRFNLFLASGAAGGLLALVALAYAFQRGVTHRLATLVANCERLGEGRPLLPAGSSRDEIGNLDAAFRRMADELDRQRQLKLQGLAEAAALVVSARESRHDLLHAITEKARVLAGAQYAESWLAADDRGALGTRVWRSAAEPPPPGTDAQCPQGLWEEVRGSGRLARASDGRRQWLAAPLTYRHGSTVGLVATAKEEAFRTEDELVLVQLAHLGAVVLQIRHAYEQLEHHASELAALNEDLTQKTEENELFVYSVSHDLRSPLVNLEGFSRELESVSSSLRALLGAPGVPADVRAEGERLLDEDMREAVHFIRAAVGRLGRIIEGLLKLSRAGRVQYRSDPVDAGAVVARVVEGMHATIAERGAQVSVGPLGAVRADATALEQVFGNLLDNALKYAAPGRTPSIAIGEADPPSPAERVFVVRDNGLGVPEAYRETIFHPLQRVHADVAAGEGLGLAIARRLIERQHGRIWLESEDGRGTAFFIALPRAAEGEAAAGAARERLADAV